MNADKPVKSCVGCIYYYVTWDARAPKGCRYFGFKSKQMPCVVVRQSSGQHCIMYTPKTGIKDEGKKGKGNNIDWKI